MAGDDNEARHDASEHGGPSVDGKPVDPNPKSVEAKPGSADSVVSDFAVSDSVRSDPASTIDSTPAQSHPALAGATASEWTVSDVRGPLNAAGSARPLEPGGDIAEQGIASTPMPSSGSPSAPSPATAEPHRRGSVWPVAAGIVVGALIGAGSAYYVYVSSGPGASGDAMAALDRKLAALTTRVDGLAAAKPPAASDIAPLKAALADLAAKVAATDALARGSSAKADAAKDSAKDSSKTAADRTPLASAAPDNAAAAALASKVAAVEAALGTLKQQAASGVDVKAVQDSVAGLKTNLADLQKQGADNARQDGDLQKRIATSESDVVSLRAGQKTLEGRITAAPALAVVADSLVSQIDRGLPFALQVNALDSLGVDPAKIAVLRQSADQGVPSAKALADSFEPLTGALLAVDRKLAPNASFWDRMKSGAGSLVSVQRVDDVGGDDIPSRVARIKADLVHDDVVAALAVWNTLPADARTKPAAAAWGALAKTHAEAIVAANAIEHDAIASLGAKKS